MGALPPKVSMFLFRFGELILMPSCIAGVVRRGCSSYDDG